MCWQRAWFSACTVLQLKELKQELGALRVAKVTGGAPNKLSKMYAFCYKDILSPQRLQQRFPIVTAQIALTALDSLLHARMITCNIVCAASQWPARLLLAS